MRREFAYGIIAGLILGYLWLRYTPPAEKPKRGKTQPIRIVEKPA